MCGISGIISKNKLTVETIFNSLKQIKHRGPDNTLLFNADEKEFLSCSLSNINTQQYFLDYKESKDACNWFGFNRLSIVDLSENGMQPFYDKANELIFMLNGEVYNYDYLRSEFLNNVAFKSHSDAEVAMQLYIKMGDDFVHHLKGMFAIVIYDLKNKNLKLFRDRLGIKPIYYYHDKEKFLFSSEIEGIFVMNLIKRKLNTQALAYSMYLGTSPFPLTIYENIYTLPPGKKLILDSEFQQNIETYWKIPLQETVEKSTDYFEKNLKEIVKLYYAKEVKSAVSLSGGLDSGTLAYLMGNSHHNLDAIHITNSDGYELKQTKINAENAKLNLIYNVFDQSKINEIEIQNIEDEPNFILETTWIVSKFAQENGFKVVYNALGPDEIFGGYAYFRKALWLKFLMLFFKMIPSFFVPKKHKTKLNEIKKYGIYTLGILARKGFEWQEIKEMFQQNNWDIPNIHPIEYIENQINREYPEYELLPLLKKMAFLDIYYYISSHHAVRNEKPSMVCSIETRFPFLDHEFISYYLNLKGVYKGILIHQKPYFKKKIKKWLHKEVLQMKKKGFTVESNFSKEDTKNYYLEMLNHIITRKTF